MNSNLPCLTACPIYPGRDQARVGEILRDVDLTRSSILSHSGAAGQRQRHLLRRKMQQHQFIGS